MYFCKKPDKQYIKQLSEERLRSVKSPSEPQQDNFFDTIENIKRNCLVIASHRVCM